MWKNFNFNNLYNNSADDIRAMQSYLGFEGKDQDSMMGPKTIKALQKKLGLAETGKWDSNAAAAAKAYNWNGTTNGGGFFGKVKSAIKDGFNAMSNALSEDIRGARSLDDTPKTPSVAKSLTLDEAKAAYQAAGRHSTLSASVPLLKLLFTTSDKSAMDEATKDQLAVLLKYYGDRVNTVDDLSAAGEYGSEEREAFRKRMSPINYKHEGTLSGQDSNVNVQGVEKNQLSRVLGSFGTVKDKNGTFLIDDTYDNEVYRLPKNHEAIEALRAAGVNLQESKGDPNHYIVTRDDFGKLQEHGVLSGSRWGGIWTVAKGVFNDLIGNREFSDASRTQRFKKIGENAIVQTGASQAFDFTMDQDEIDRRVARSLARVG